jgi:hypothetical protein
MAKSTSQFCEVQSVTEKGMRIWSFYPVPVMTASTLNVVSPVMLGDTESVIVADRTWFAASAAPSLFQVMVIGPFAVGGFQFVFVRLSVTWDAPMFLTYTVLVTVAPGERVPQLYEVTLLVQALSE